MSKETGKDNLRVAWVIAVLFAVWAVPAVYVWGVDRINGLFGDLDVSGTITTVGLTTTGTTTVEGGAQTIGDGTEQDLTLEFSASDASPLMKYVQSSDGLLTYTGSVGSDYDIRVGMTDRFTVDATGASVNGSLSVSQTFNAAGGTYTDSVNFNKDTITDIAWRTNDTDPARPYFITYINGNMEWEGATADEFETTLICTDPTADRTITIPDASGTLQFVPAQTITVAKSGGQFDTIQAAIDSITDAATDKRYLVLVYPGDYAETVTGKSFVELMGVEAREAVNITGATGPLYTFPDDEGHIFNLKFSLSPTTANQEIIDVPATVNARQVVSNCLFKLTSASDINSSMFDVNGGELEVVDSKIIFTHTGNNAGVKTHRIFDVDGDSIVDVSGNIVDIDISDIDDVVNFFDDSSTTGGDTHIVHNVVHLTSNNSDAASVILRALVVTSTVGPTHIQGNFFKLTSSETAGTGRAEYIRLNSAAGGAIVNSIGNRVNITGFATNYWANVASGDNIVSHFDDIVAASGWTGAGAAVYVSALSDGAVTATGLITTGVGLDALGAVDMDYGSVDVLDHTFITDSTGDAEIVLPNDSIGPAEILDSVAAAFLTMDGTGLNVDAEVYTDTKCHWRPDPTADTDDKSIWTTNGFAATITKIWCESDQTVNADLQIDDGSPLDVAGTDLVCDSTPAEDEAGLTGSMADGDRLDLAITSTSGTPTWVSICWTYVKVD